MSRSILVTGGSRGIGRDVCIALSKKGHSVIINYVNNHEAANETKRLCEEVAVDSSQRFLAIQADIADNVQRARLLERIDESFGTLDVLVNNAGVAPRCRADLLDMSEESYDALMNVNLKGPLFLTQLVARHWQQRHALRDKIIIFISSISATTVSTNRAEYCISKAGIAMTASLFAARLASDGVLVFEVRPGIIKTGMTLPVAEKYDRLIEEGVVPQGRWGTGEDIGKTVAALCSDDFPFSTGSVIMVDGGLHIPRL